MMKRGTLGRSERGDTIVEVLIAIAIVSMVLTAAYVITNKNTAAIQANQERIQAQHLVESQIEALRAHNGLTVADPAIDNCFNGMNPTSGSACTVSATGSGASYELNITGPASNVYTVSAKWTGLGDSGTNGSDVTMYYRVN